MISKKISHRSLIGLVTKKLHIHGVSFGKFYKKHRKILVGIKILLILFLGILLFAVWSGNGKNSLLRTYAGGGGSCGNGVVDGDFCDAHPNSCSDISLTRLQGIGADCTFIDGCDDPGICWGGHITCSALPDTFCNPAGCRRDNINGKCNDPTTPDCSYITDTHICNDLGIFGYCYDNVGICASSGPPIDCGKLSTLCSDPGASPGCNPATLCSSAGCHWDKSNKWCKDPSIPDCSDVNGQKLCNGAMCSWKAEGTICAGNMIIPNNSTDCISLDGKLWKIGGYSKWTPGEICDDGGNNGSPGYCNTTCDGYVNPPPTTYCGDGSVQTPNSNGVNEICDNGSYNGSVGYCNTSCNGYVNPPPTTYCGDNWVQKPNSNGFYEQCDTTKLDNKTCTGLNYQGGILSCNANCTLNTGNCTSTTQRQHCNLP